jgi:ankyrin repeat protein
MLKDACQLGNSKIAGFISKLWKKKKCRGDYTKSDQECLDRAMLMAASVGPLSVVQSLFVLRHSLIINGGDQIKNQQETDEKALLKATAYKQRDTMAYLLCKDVKVTSETLVQACREGFDRELELLTSRKVLVDLTPCIRNMAEAGNVSAIQKLVRLGAQYPPTRDEEKRPIRTPLAAAASNGSVEMVRFILQAFGHSILLDGRDCEEFTGLVSAASRGCDVVVALLLDGGADIETRGVGQHTEQTALITAGASGTGSEKVVKLLLRAGARMENKDADLKTPLLAAVETGSEATIRLLLNAFADINAVLKEGDTVLHIAAKRSRLLVVKWLLDTGADPKAVTRVGATVLSGAITKRENAPEVVQLLLNVGANPEDMSINGKSAVIEAFETNKAIFETIISHPLWARSS